MEADVVIHSQALGWDPGVHFFFKESWYNSPLRYSSCITQSAKSTIHGCLQKILIVVKDVIWHPSHMHTQRCTHVYEHTHTHTHWSSLAYFSLKLWKYFFKQPCLTIEQQAMNLYCLSSKEQFLVLHYTTCGYTLIKRVSFTITVYFSEYSLHVLFWICSTFFSYFWMQSMLQAMNNNHNGE